MQPIASPDKTIDSTIDSSAVAGSQIERAVLERIGLDHHDFVVGIPVVPIGGKGHGAVDTREALEVVKIADDLRRLGAGVLHRLGDQAWTVIAERDPPQERVAHVDFGALQAVEESDGAVRKLAVWAVTNRAEVVGIDLGPILRLFKQSPP